MAPDLIKIDDPDDPRIAAYRDIRERDLVGRQGRFVAEGKVVLEVLLAARRFPVESLLLLENRIGGMADTLERVRRDVPVYVASRPILDAIAGFPVHRGILAMGLRRAPESCADLLAQMPDRATIVVPVGIANHDNMGSIFRNAAAFGADAVIFDAECCDPLYRKAIRVSVGAVLRMPFARAEQTREIVQQLERFDFDIVALSPGGETEIGNVKRSARMAIFLGSEGDGLSTQLLADLPTVRIAIKDDFDSLNVAAASAIALHHLR